MGCRHPLGGEMPDGPGKDRHIECHQDFLPRGEGRGYPNGLGGTVIHLFQDGRKRCRGQGEHRQALKQLHRDNAGREGAGGGDQCRPDNRGGMGGSGGGQNAHGRGRDQLNGTGVDRKKSAHGVGGRPWTRVQRLESLHRLESERGGRVAESEHVGGDIHHHGPHGGMIGGDFGKQPGEQGPEE